MSPRPSPSQSRPARQTPWIPRALTALSLLAIALATLIPSDTPLRPIPRFCLACGELGGVDFALNIILFIPYGVSLYLLLNRRWKSIAIVALTTLSIELLQLDIIANRDSSLGDLVANTLGGSIGVFLTFSWRHWLTPSPRIAKYLSYAGLTLWTALLALGGWALQPAPTATPWYGLWAPQLEQFEQFTGTLHSAFLNDSIALAFGRFPTEQRNLLQHQFRNTEIKIATTVTPGPANSVLANSGQAPIVSIYDQRQREVLFLGQMRSSVVFHLRTRTSNIRLREPIFIGLQGIFPDTVPAVSDIPAAAATTVPAATPAAAVLPAAVPTTTQSSPAETTPRAPTVRDDLQITAQRTRSAVILEAHSPTTGPAQRIEIPLNTFLLWNTVLPFNLPLDGSTKINLLSMLWALGLLILPAYWWRFRTQARRSLPILLAITAIVIATLPRFYSLQSSPWWAWLASAMGLALGWYLSSIVQSSKATNKHPLPTCPTP